MASLEELARAFAQVEEEIRALQGRYSGLESSSQGAFASVRQRIESIEEGMRDRGRGHGEDGGKGGRSLIHPKMLNPAVLSQSDHWRKWKGDVEEYCEHIHRGMKDIMDQATKADGEIEEQWFHNTEDCWWDRSEVLWSFLRRFIDGEARRVVLSVSNCNGWNAWRKLHQNFEPSLAARVGQVMASFTGMVNRKAKNQAETRSMMLEVDERARRVEEMTGTAPEERHTMSVIAGFLDNETLKHTMQYQGMGKSVRQPHHAHQIRRHGHRPCGGPTHRHVLG